MKHYAIMRTAMGLLLGVSAWLVAGASGAPPIDIDSIVRDLTSKDAQVRGRALFDLLSSGRWQGNAPLGVDRVLKAHADKADLIKTALIFALENHNAFVEDSRRKGLALSEYDSEVWANLVWAVSHLRDPRGLNALVGAIHTGGMATGGLADLGPPAVSAAIGRLNDEDAEVRTAAVQVLGGFLTRLDSVRSNPEAADRAKAAILRALDDADAWVRRAAVRSLLPLNDVPEVRAKLQSMARQDPEIRWDIDGRARFPVREAAASVLTMNKVDLYYVFRSPDSGVCRIGKPPNPGEEVSLFGPFESEDVVKHVMCTHVDSTGKDPKVCWGVQPTNACQQ
jgi:HEAT repeat protein